MKQAHAELISFGCHGWYCRAAAFAREGKAGWDRERQTTGRGRFVPLTFKSGEALWFDRSEDWAIIGNERTKLQVGPPQSPFPRVRRHSSPRGTGTGKTHVATAIGVQAIEHHHKRVRFFSTVELVNALEQEKAQGRSGQIANRLLHSALLILDELGSLPSSASGGAFSSICIAGSMSESASLSPLT
jgi:hypothetical protein